MLSLVVDGLVGCQVADLEKFDVGVDDWKEDLLLLAFGFDGAKARGLDGVVGVWREREMLLQPRPKLPAALYFPFVLFEEGLLEEVAGSDHRNQCLKPNANIISRPLQSVIRMQKTKQSAHSVSSSIRPVTITSNFKHEKVEKLNQIVRNINEAKVEEGGVQQGTLVGDRVLEKLKERIKTNYDQLYTNYHHNKTKILKQIQTVESNIAGENHMQVRQEEVIREKARCDRLRARVEDLQKKLTRLNDLRGQLVSEVNAPSLEPPGGNQLRLADLDEKKEMIDHSYSVLEEMFRQRKAVELCLKARYTKLSAQLGRVRERAEKMAAQNQHKKLQIAKLTDQLERQQHIEIPSKLAQQLSSKIEQYQNKQAYAQILQNEAVLEQQRFQTMKAEAMKKREEQRQAKLKRQGQQKNAMEEMQVLYMIGQLEQEKLKRLCAVEEIRGVVQGDLELDGRSLEKVQSEIQAEIQKMTQENAVVQSEIQQIIAGKQQEGLPQQNIERLNLKLEEQTKKKKQLHSQYAKKSKLANEWLTLMHLINGNRVSKEAQSELLREIIGTKTKVASERSKMGGSSCASELFQAEDFK